MMRYLILSRFPQTVRQLGIGKVVAVGAVCGLVFLGGCKPSANGDVAATTQVAQIAQDSKSSAPEVAPTETPAPAAHNPQARKQPIKAVADEPREAAPAGKAITIAGGWVNEGGACDSGASVFFNADGTYLSEGEKGTWALSGKTLTVTSSTSFDEAELVAQGPEESVGDTGEKAVLTLLSLTDDAARVVLSNGSNANWTRCSS